MPRSFRHRLKTSSRIVVLLILVALSLASAVGLAGCGSGGFLGKAQGQTSYTITIHATSGQLDRQSTVQLNFE